MTVHPLAVGYLRDLRRAAQRLPRQRRSELIADVESHLAEALGDAAGTIEVREVLGRLGEPEEIVEAAAPRREAPGMGSQVFTVLLLLFGGFAVLVGWVIGAARVWDSPVWTTRDKVIGTLLLPGGLFTSMWILLASSRSPACRKRTGPSSASEARGPWAHWPSPPWP